METITFDFDAIVAAHETAHARRTSTLDTGRTSELRAAYATFATLPVNATPRARMAAFTTYAAVRDAQIAILQGQVKALLAERRQGAVDALLAALPQNMSERRVALLAVIDVAKGELKKIAPDATTRAAIGVVRTDARQTSGEDWAKFLLAHRPDVAAAVEGKSVSAHAVSHAYVPADKIPCEGECLYANGRPVRRTVAGFEPIARA